jgi:uncharacterized phage infection (PIP) family protein YhgE
VELNNIKETINYKNPMVRDLFDTIEAQQQEIEQLHNEAENVLKATLQRISEHKQLQAQMAAMREVVEQFKYDYEQGENMQSNYHDAYELLRTDAGKDYHNPADVEALKLAREALKRCMISAFSQERNMAGEALAAIDKVLGGDTP